MSEPHPHVAIVGGEPAALACAARLLLEGVKVTHLLPAPWGLLGASREIGLVYPELGEPLERLEFALGAECAAEFHGWERRGMELLFEHGSDHDGFRRGSRLLLSRSPQESALLANDALYRSRVAGDQVRLMSGAAASNYAPLTTEVDQAIFETHAAAFAPTSMSDYLLHRLVRQADYRVLELPCDGDWEKLSLRTIETGVRIGWEQTSYVEADLAVVGAGLETSRLLGKLGSALVPLLGQAFLTAPLREMSRASVVGVTTSWGYERYRFDSERRLLACAIDPGSGERHEVALALPQAQEVAFARARQLFADLDLEAPLDAMWGVLFAATCDGLPLLGPLPGEPRIHVAAGFSTSAWSRGYAAGDIVARGLLGEIATPMLQRCSPRRLV